MKPCSFTLLFSHMTTSAGIPCRRVDTVFFANTGCLTGQELKDWILEVTEANGYVAVQIEGIVYV